MDNALKTKVNFIVIILLTTALAWTTYFAIQHHASPTQKPTIHGLLFDKSRALPPFSFHSSKHSFNDRSLTNYWSLIFFGYTSCPDVCPTTLTTLNQAYQKLPHTLQKKIQIIFISIDPYRDTQKHVNEYTHYFNPNFIGLTGSKHQIKQLTSALGVPYWIKKQPKVNNYTVDHGSMIALINPMGRYQGFFSAPHYSAVISKELQQLTNYYNETTIS